MTTYYEVLDLQPTATLAEIEAAYETRYNHWRRLATHHDPQMAHKATQALNWLDKIRATLANPAARVVYDASIGLGGPMSGLADPEAKARVTAPSPPPPSHRSGSDARLAETEEEKAGVWICPQCQATSTAGTPFCPRCGQEMGQACPQCGGLVYVSDTFCGTCGLNVRQPISPPKLHTRLTAAEPKETAKVAQEVGSWHAIYAGEQLISKGVVDGLDRGLVMSLGMVKDGFKTHLLLHLNCDRPVQVQISTKAAWIQPDRRTLSLEAGRPQTVKVNIDMTGLESGRAYHGELAVTAQGETSTTIVHHVLLGIKKFLASGDAEKTLREEFFGALKAALIPTLFITDMLDQAKQALANGQAEESASAYARAVRFLRDPETKREVDFSKPTASSIMPSHPTYLPSQRWHQTASQLPTGTFQSPGIGWENWNPFVPLGTHTPFHMAPLWTFNASLAQFPTQSAAAGPRVAFPLESNIGLDVLTGMPIRAAWSEAGHLLLGVGQDAFWSWQAVSDGEMVFHIDGRRLVAKSVRTHQPLWQSSKVGMIGAKAGKVVMGQQHVYLQCGQIIAAFDKQSGHRVWKKKVSTASPVIHLVESNGLLIAVYPLPYVEVSAGNERRTVASDTLVGMAWWSAQTGKGGAECLPRRSKDDFPKRTEDASYLCIAVAPIMETKGSVKILVAHNDFLYEVTLANNRLQTEQASTGSRRPVYMHVFGNACWLVSSDGPHLNLHSIKIPLRSSSSPQSSLPVSRGHTILGYKASFSKEEETVLKLGNNEDKRQLLFDMSLIGGVLILCPRFKDGKGKILAII